MTEQWDGVPENPERDGWHWLCAAVGIGAPYPMLWCADGKAWDTGDGWIFCTDPALTERRRYLGPCLTPAEVTAREAASAEAMREACAKRIEEVREWGGQDYYCDSCKGGAIYPDREDEGRRLRALPLPHASALARAEKAAYQRGWNDRESDFLTGVERTGMAVVGPDALAAAEKRGMERAADMARHWPTGITTNGAIALSEAIRNAAARENER